MTNITCKLASVFLAFALMDVARCGGQSPLPTADFRAINEAIQRDFGSIDEIRTIGMTDDPGGRFDVIVIGSKPRYGGWRVEVLSVTHHRLTTRWDSGAIATGIEFEMSGPKAVKITVRDYGYDLFIEACAPHLCSDGVSGFLIFSGKSDKTSKAKVVTQGLDKGYVADPKYDVSFSKNLDDESRKKLEDEICQSRSISNKSGLPFECKKP